ncbi:MAG: hypothetical protein ACXAB2_15595 [Candidatus Hodarchaeales archaeon]|jgi:hypothetical protein
MNTIIITVFMREISNSDIQYSFHNPECNKNPHKGQTDAWIVWNRVCILWNENHGKVTPQVVVELFNNPELNHDLWPECNLYDVWVRAIWEADNLMWGGPSSISNELVSHHAELDQIAALIEESMYLANHQPLDTR